MARTYGRKGVFKLSTTGRVVARYESLTMAAKMNYISIGGMYGRIHGRTKGASDGFVYRYEK